MKAKRKWLLAGIAVALALGGAMAIPFFIDEPPPDDTDLLPGNLEIPWEENGYHVFNVEPHGVYLPESEGEETPTKDELASGERWDPGIARQILDRNADVLRKLEECLARPGLQFPMAEGHEIRAGNRRPWLPATDLLLIRARYRLKEGNLREAARDAERAIRLGRRVQTAGGLLVHFMSGLAIESFGLQALQAVARSPDLDPALLGPMAREVGSASGIEAARETLRTQYAHFSYYIDRVLSDPDYSAILWDTPSIWRDPLCLKPNASRRLLAEKLRVLSKNLELPALQRTDLRIEALQAGPIRRWLPRPNAVGRSAVAFHLVALEKSIESVSSRDLTQAFTAALMACRCWKARHGALPPTLDALVPEYLDTVPRDPYDGKPLRYSAEKRIVYSVGNDGKDSGGLADPDTDNACVYRAEPTLRIEP